jgi:hypothetical protein
MDMASAKEAIRIEPALYNRDFCLWVEEQARLLKQGRFEQLDVANLIEEIEHLGSGEKKAVENNLVVVLKHLMKYRFQPSRRSRTWLSSIAEHRRRLRNDLNTSPSLRPYARERFGECYQDSRRQALIETGSHRTRCRLPILGRSSRPSTRTSCRTRRVAPPAAAAARSRAARGQRCRP